MFVICSCSCDVVSFAVLVRVRFIGRARYSCSLLCVICPLFLRVVPVLLIPVIVRVLVRVLS